MGWYSASIGISKDISVFSIGVVSNLSNFANAKQYSQTAYITWYPMGNLNLYLSYSPTLHSEVSTSTSSFLIDVYKRQVHEH